MAEPEEVLDAWKFDVAAVTGILYKTSCVMQPRACSGQGVKDSIQPVVSAGDKF